MDKDWIDTILAAVFGTITCTTEIITCTFFVLSYFDSKKKTAPRKPAKHKRKR